jgi:peptide/nickel transport system substrate-binding protein
MTSRFTERKGIRPPRRRILSIAAVVAAAVLALTGCTTSQGGGGKTATATSLTWGMATSPRSLFAPTNYSLGSGSVVMSLIQSQLLNISPEGKLEPGVASKWEAVNSTTYTYTIGNAVFSNGDKVTAEDVAYSLNLQLDPKVASQEGGLFSNVDSVKYSGDVVTVKLKKADSLWQYLPASIAGYVYEKKSVEASLASYGTPETLPIGSGPYMVSKFVPDSQVVLKRNPKYVGAKATYDTITFKVIPDAQTMLLAMSSGEIDGTFDVPASSIGQWKAAAEVSTFPGLHWQGLTLDMTEAPFSDIHVRKALYYATDRQALVDGLLGGVATLSTTVNDPAIFAATLGKSEVSDSFAKIATFPFDLAKAKQELAMSSVPNGFSLTLNVPEDSAEIVATSQAIKADWAKIGVNVNLNMMPGGPRFQVIMDHKANLGVQIIGNTPDVPDPAEMPWEYFSSDQAVTNGNNSSNLNDPKVNDLIAQAQASTDAKKAAQLILQAQILAGEQVPVIPIASIQFIVAVKTGGTAKDMGPWYGQTVWTNGISLK